MNAQEIFDTVARHLHKQGKRAGKYDNDSRDEADFRCLYRGPEGTKCAVGCLIPDELYDPNIEGLSVSDIKDVLLKAGIGAFALLGQLQNVHDTAWSWEQPGGLCNRLTAVAKDYGLNAAVIEELWPS